MDKGRMRCKCEKTIWTNNEGFTISTDKSLLDIEIIHNFLSNESYWVKGIAKELVQASIDNSILCYGIDDANPYNGSVKQIGFVRVVSDLVRFTWIGDEGYKIKK